MWVADMDFRSPPEVETALTERVAHGVFGYTNPTSEAISAICEYMADVHDVDVSKDWLLWTPGLVPALNTAARAFCNPGETVLTTVPIYPPFLSAPKYQHRELLVAPLANDGGRYTYDWNALEAAVRPSTRVFFMCNPHNPVGRVWSLEELDRVAAFCQERNLILVSDEIHCDLILAEKLKHYTAMKLGSWVVDNSITLMSPSKTYNLCGLACSFVIIPNTKLRRAFHRSMRGLFNELNCLGYVACAAAYQSGAAWRSELISVLRTNYHEISDFCKTRMPLIKLTPLEATYLAWLDIRALKLNNPRTHFESCGVGLSDGVEFGTPGFLRMNFGCPTTRVCEALAQMENAYNNSDCFL
jgi:cystathionine beta-lyase